MGFDSNNIEDYIPGDKYLHFEDLSIQSRLSDVDRPNVTVKNIHFKHRVLFSNKYSSCYFENCHFEKGLEFDVPAGSSTGKVSKTFDFDINLIDCRVDEIFNINDCTFDEKVRIHDCEILEESSKLCNQSSDKKSRCNFENTKFNDLADFWKTTFKTETIFYKTDFNATAVFSFVTFYKNVLFTYTLLAGKTIFAKTNFIKGMDISQAVISGELQLFDVYFDNEIFETKYFDRTNKKEYQNAIDKKAVIPTENKVHTFQILRKAFEDVGDYNDSTRMRRAEKKALREFNQGFKIQNNSEIWYKRLKKWFNDKVDLNSRDIITNDGIILLLNRLSNDYRTSFLRGSIFTAVIAGFFLSITLLFKTGYSFTINPLKFQWIKFIVFLNPLHDIKDIVSGPDIGSYIFDYLGRVFVGYGIYQTVQAFRKFR